MGLRITEAVRVIKLFLTKFPFDPLPSISWKQKVFDILMFSGGSKENLEKKWIDEETFIYNNGWYI